MKVRRPSRARLWVEELECRVVPSTSVLSTNWSGYAALPSTGSVSMVSGSWTVPTATPIAGANNTYSSFWVGIDGYNSNTVEQIGTDSDIQNGVATYYAWYEMYPAASKDIALAVNVGDTITASVTYTAPSSYTLKLTDTKTGGTFSTTQKLAGASNSSAEWVAEAPYAGNSEATLSNFGSVNFTSASTTIGAATGPIDDSAWENVSINMVTGSNSSVVASTGALADAGAPATSSFTITYAPPPAPPPPPPPPPPHHHHGWGGHSGWRGPEAGYTELAGDPAAGTIAPATPNFAAGSASTSFATTPPAPLLQLAAIHPDAPALAPILSPLNINGPHAGSPAGAEEAADDTDSVSIWLPAPSSFAEFTAVQRSQPTLVTDGAPMQVVLGEQARDVFAAPLPVPTPTPTPEQHGGNADNLVARTFSKALWLVGTVAFVAHGAFAGKSRRNDVRDEETPKKA